MINKINEVGRLKFGINMHSAASAHSLMTGDLKFSEIWYCWYVCHCIFTASIFCSFSYASVCWNLQKGDSNCNRKI